MRTDLASNQHQIQQPVPKQSKYKAPVISSWSHVSNLFNFEFLSREGSPGIDFSDVETPRPDFGGHLTVQPNEISKEPKISNGKEEIAEPHLDLKVMTTGEKGCHRADQIEAVHTSEASASYST